MTLETEDNKVPAKEGEVKILRRPEQWLETQDFNNFIILDPDGWDRNNWEESWNEPISSTEMWQRLAKSTTGLKSPKA